MSLIVPPGFLPVRCVVVNFAIDGVVLDHQPSDVQLNEPQPTIVRVTDGGSVASPRDRGHRIVARWGERLGVSIDTVVEVKARIGSTLAHTLTWTEPDGTARSFDVILLDRVNPQFQRPTSYQPFFLSFVERPA